MAIEHLSSDTTPEEAAAILKRDGAVIIDRLVTPAKMDAILGEMKPFEEANRAGVDEFSGHSTRRTGALIARSPSSHELIMHPLVLGACDAVLSHATSYHLHLTQIIAIGAGESVQSVHRDQWAFDFFSFPKGYEVQCNTIWAMTDFTERNGATRVVPGSHLYEDKLQLKHEDTLPAEMEKGSVLLYTGAVYHGGGANQSDETRKGLNLTYAVSWLTQEENQFLSVPREIASTLPKPMQRLMGYARAAYALNYVDDLRDPLAVLDPKAAKLGFGDVKLEDVQAKMRRQ